MKSTTPVTIIGGGNGIRFSWFGIGVMVLEFGVSLFGRVSCSVSFWSSISRLAFWFFETNSVFIFYLMGDCEEDRECLGGFVDVHDWFFYLFLGYIREVKYSFETLGIMFLL